MQLQYSFVCLGYDESKGAPTFQYLVHELPLGPFPYTFPSGSGIFLVNGFVELRQATEIVLVIKTPRQKLLLEQTLKLEPMEGLDRVLSVAFLEEVAFPEAGFYRIEVLHNGQTMTSYPFEIVEADEA